jgi:DNA-binding transcriptional ArsR family regulator
MTHIGRFDRAISRLRTAGLFPTFERMAVLDRLMRAERPLAIAEILDQLADEELSLSWDAVEGALASLERAGLCDWGGESQPGPAFRLDRRDRGIPESDSPQSPERLCPFLKALANPQRLRILCQLADGERCVGQMVASLGISQSLVSQHLACLRDLDLVKADRRGRQVVYSVGEKAVPALRMARDLAAS